MRTIFDQPDAADVHVQFDRLVAALRAKLRNTGEHLAEAREHVLSFTAFPRECWTQIWSINPQERLNREMGRRTDVFGIFPDRAALVRPISYVQQLRIREARRLLERTTMPIDEIGFVIG